MTVKWSDADLPEQVTEALQTEYNPSPRRWSDAGLFADTEFALTHRPDKQIRLSPAPARLRSTGYAATRKVTTVPPPIINFTISILPGTADTAGYAVVLSETGHVLAAVDVGNIQINSQAASTGATGNVLATVGAGGMQAAGYAAAPSTTGNVVAAIDAYPLQAVGQVGSISRTGHVISSIGVANLQAGGYILSYGVTNHPVNINSTQPAGSAAFAGQAPQPLVASLRAVAAGIASIGGIAPLATVVLTKLLSPASAVMSFTGYLPGVVTTLNRVYPINVGAVSFSGKAVTINVTLHRIMQPAAQSVAVTAYNPFFVNSADVSSVWTYPVGLLAMVQTMVARGWNTGPVDPTGLTLPTRSNGVVYIDTTAVTNGTGAAYTTPKNTIPSLVSNTEYRFKGGTTYVGPGDTTSILAASGKTNITICSYDPATGARLSAQPVAKTRAMAAGWVSESERTTQYACIDGNWTPPVNGSYPSIVSMYNCTNIIVHGIEFKNWGVSAVQARVGSTVRMQSCIFGWTRHDSRINLFTGNVVRCDSGVATGVTAAQAAAFIEVSNSFFYTNNEDVGWCSINDIAHGIKFYDCAIVSTMDGNWHGNNHSDILQTSIYDYCGIYGCIVDHCQLHTTNSGSQPYQGKLFIGSGGDPRTAAVLAGGGGATIQDVIDITKYDCVYYDGAPVSVTRLGAVLLPGPVVPGGPTQIEVKTHNQGTVSTDQTYARISETNSEHWLYHARPHTTTANTLRYTVTTTVETDRQ